VSYFDVGDFIERAYETCVQNDTYFWFMLDVMQGYYDDEYGYTGEGSDNLFRTRDEQPRSYNIPTVHLSHVMRNTHEVIKLTNEIHEGDVNDASDTVKEFLPTPQVGHKVTSRIPVHHKLYPSTDDKNRLPFIIARLREVLKSITNPPYSLPLSSVAIIWDDEDTFNKHKGEITSFLTTEFGTTPQSIEKQLTSNNSTDIMDVWDNIMSFESPAVVYICHYGRDHYNICTRASLTIIDVDKNESFFDEPNNIDTVWWKPDDDNTFIKYTCTCNEPNNCKC